MASGWSGESKRHSIAKKYGAAGSKRTWMFGMMSTPSGQRQIADDEKIEALLEIGRKENLTPDENELFVTFMIRAFPDESRYTYYNNEWAQRIASGHPERWLTLPQAEWAYEYAKRHMAALKWFEENIDYDKLPSYWADKMVDDFNIDYNSARRIIKLVDYYDIAKDEV